MAFFMNGFPFEYDGSAMDEEDDYEEFHGFRGFNSQAGEEEKPVDTTKLYKTLGVEKSASQEEIRKAYKKMAYKHHPDRGGDQTIFQEVQLAYEILNDENKRKVYDNYGEEGLREGRGEDFRGSIFDLLDGRARGTQKRKSKSVLYTLNVTLEDIYIGRNMNYDISRYRTCQNCKGNGSKDINANTKCMGCQGKGIKIVAKNIGYGYVQQSVECAACNGEGRVIKEKDKCLECKGERAIKVNKTLEIHIDKGTHSGKRIVFAGESDEVPGLEPGDIIIELNIKEHKKFQRKGGDLIYTADISLLEALTGFNLVIEHLDGRQICVQNEVGEIIKPGMIKTVKECGMPLFDAPYKYGDLYIKFNIIFPEKLDNSQIDLLNKLFPDLVQKEIKEKVEESYTMVDFHPDHENTNHAGGKGQQKEYDEDKEEEHPFGGARTMRCDHQ